MQAAWQYPERQSLNLVRIWCESLNVCRINEHGYESKQAFDANFLHLKFCHVLQTHFCVHKRCWGLIQSPIYGSSTCLEGQWMCVMITLFLQFKLCRHFGQNSITGEISWSVLVKLNEENVKSIQAHNSKAWVRTLYHRLVGPYALNKWVNYNVFLLLL